ncbi:hypothetical protein [Xanthomonas oryzae]|uniref:hypothetical protein n=1 Tax=Xanthomonas oryzae TaxID=347 RepID=UPI000A9AE4C3|nr:hypothetical protein [Xanthomonas oryzae]
MPTMFTRSIRLEVAQDVLGALIAHWAEAAAKVWDAANPDASRLAAIQAEQRKLRILRDELDPRDTAQIEVVIAEHAPLLCPRVSGGASLRCPRKFLQPPTTATRGGPFPPPLGTGHTPRNCVEIPIPRARRGVWAYYTDAPSV